MRPKLKVRSILVCVLCPVAFGAGAILSNEDMLSRLPVYQHFKCAICHTTANPSLEEHTLNPFGVAFQENGNQWNGDLARRDSDNDGYRNGVELGDEDGDGVAEVTMERSNPGDPQNHPNSVDEETWTAIKNIFKE